MELQNIYAFFRLNWISRLLDVASNSILYVVTFLVKQTI